MKYQILTASAVDEMEEKVNAELAKGWMLFGGVSVSSTAVYSEHTGIDETFMMFQAMFHNAFA